MGFLKRLSEFFNPSKKERRLNIEELEDLLIEADLGGTLSVSISKDLAEASKAGKLNKSDDIKEELTKILASKINEFDLSFLNDVKKYIFLILGVNGAGKTTTCAKLANYYSKNNRPVLLAAADTFRAAAVEQLTEHSRRLGVRLVKSENAGNPAAVIFDALESFKSGSETLLVADTAGRMHTREDLVREIGKIDKIVNSKFDSACYKKFLVIDSTTGQNALEQAEIFDKNLGLDALIMTKLDSSSKGGAIFKVASNLNLPVAYYCNGETYDDIHPFDKLEFINNILTKDA